MLAGAATRVEVGFQHDQQGQSHGGRVQRYPEDTTDENGQVQRDDAAIGLGSEVVNR